MCVSVNQITSLVQVFILFFCMYVSVVLTKADCLYTGHRRSENSTLNADLGGCYTFVFLYLIINYNEILAFTILDVSSSPTKTSPSDPETKGQST